MEPQKKTSVSLNAGGFDKRAYIVPAVDRAARMAS